MGGEAASAAAVAPVAPDADPGVRICTCGFKYSKANPSTYVVKVHESTSIFSYTNEEESQVEVQGVLLTLRPADTTAGFSRYLFLLLLPYF